MVLSNRGLFGQVPRDSSPPVSGLSPQSVGPVIGPSHDALEGLGVSMSQPRVCSPCGAQRNWRISP
jgi:hypothetical protein